MAGGALLLDQQITNAAGAAGETASGKWKSLLDQVLDMSNYAKGIQLLATGDSRTVKQPSQQQQQPPQQGGY